MLKSLKTISITKVNRVSINMDKNIPKPGFNIPFLTPAKFTKNLNLHDYNSANFALDLGVFFCYI